jgi:hypothetical protein
MSRHGDPWLDRLSGDAAGPDDADRREAGAVRDYYQRRMEEDRQAVDDPAREIRMINYLRAKGGFSGEADATPGRAGWLAGHRRFVLGGLALATVVMVTVSIAYFPVQTPRDDVLAPKTILPAQQSAAVQDAARLPRLPVADPVAEAERLAAALKQVGVEGLRVVEATPTGSLLIELKVPAERRDAVKPIVSPLGIPANGVLQFWLDPR